jgi:hypothetical protein
MPARNSWQVRYLDDYTSVPHTTYEAVTRTEHALAFRLEATYDPAMPNHALPGAVLTTSWWVIAPGAPPDAVPALITYDRARPRGQRFEVGGQLFYQLGDAMEAAV